MAFSPEDIRHLARLARLELDPEEERRLGEELEGIVAHIDALAEIPTEGAPPLPRVDPVPLRPDRVTSTPDVEGMLANAPAREGRAFRVPKVLE